MGQGRSSIFFALGFALGPLQCPPDNAAQAKKNTFLDRHAENIKLSSFLRACDGLFSLPAKEKTISWTWCALAMGFSPCASKKKPSDHCRLVASAEAPACYSSPPVHPKCILRICEKHPDVVEKNGHVRCPRTKTCCAWQPTEPGEAGRSLLPAEPGGAGRSS